MLAAGSPRGGVPCWMICYALLGVVQGGMIPVILPLAAHAGSAAGLTYSAFAATGIVAPFIGVWSDRHRRHRLTLACGLGLASLSLLAHTLPGGMAQHVLTAALTGLGAASASTVGTMFVVEVEPKPRWDEQISLLQALSGAGQVVGLFLAGLLGLHYVREAFLLSAGLLLLAVPVALAFAPDPVVRVERPSLLPRPARSADRTPIGPQRSLHGVTRQAIAGLSHSGFAWFIAAWLVSYTATNGFSVMFAVAMIHDYHVSATLPATAYAVGVGCSLLLFRWVGAWDARLGPWHVLTIGLAGRALLVAGMVALTAPGKPGTVLPILLCFMGTQVIWPLLSVSSTTLSVTLSPARQAESVGLLNAATSLAAMIGGVLGGVLLKAGFAWLCAAVLAALLVAVLLAWHPRVRLART